MSRPKYVLMLTGDDWYAPFVRSLPGFRAEPALALTDPVQQAGYYKDQVSVMDKHPQGRGKAGLASEAAKLLQGNH